MTIAERQEQFVRINRAHTVQPELAVELEATLRQRIVGVTQTTIEAALVEELLAERASKGFKGSRRSGYFKRTLDTQYGRIKQLRVPKLRSGNGERNWQILERYQRALSSLLVYSLGLYVMGLSLRDVQEALYPLLDSVLSLSAVNRISLQAQQWMERQRHQPIEQTPPILIVDGVWVTILYPTGEWQEDRAGHLRQVRRAQDRVILAAMAVWPDGSHHLLHYQVAEQENQPGWESLLQTLMERGLDPQRVQMVVSDGTTGLPSALADYFPETQQQRCITHKVRRIVDYLKYQQLPTHDEQGQPLSPSDAQQQRRWEIKHDAYEIYKAPSWDEAQNRLVAFVNHWLPLEPKAVRTFLYDIHLTFTFYDCEPDLYPLIRTSNALERFFREFRTKSDEIGAFPNEVSCLTLFYLVVQRDHAKHDRKPMAKTA